MCKAAVRDLVPRPSRRCSVRSRGQAARHGGRRLVVCRLPARASLSTVSRTCRRPPTVLTRSRARASATRIASESASFAASGIGIQAVCCRPAKAVAEPQRRPMVGPTPGGTTLSLRARLSLRRTARSSGPKPVPQRASVGSTEASNGCLARVGRIDRSAQQPGPSTKKPAPRFLADGCATGRPSKPDRSIPIDHFDG